MQLAKSKVGSSGELKKAFVTAGNSIQTYSNFRGAVRPSDSIGLIVLMALKKLASVLQEKLQKDKIFHYHITVSKGQGNVPRILYVAISRRPGVLSVEPSVTICFSENGKGFVVGMMYSKFRLKRKREPQIRSGSVMTVNLSSKRSKSKFNDLFVNPMECLVCDLNEKKLLSHLNVSLELLKDEYQI